MRNEASEVKVSILLPLSERLGTGWRSLESALAQDGPRSGYEVIAIVGGRSEQEAMDDPDARALLARCDAVVRFPEDLEAVENQLHYYGAGARASFGDVLFLAEGHTILDPRCCELIRAYFMANPASQAVSAQYREFLVTDLSKIFGLLKERRKRKGLATLPLFSVGGQSAVKRQLFETLCDVSAHSGMLAENKICEFLEQNKIAVGVMRTPLCDHTTNRTLAWYTNYSLGMGKTHFDHFNSFPSFALALKWPQRVGYACANRRWCAAMLFPTSRALGVLLLRASISVVQLSGFLAVHALLWGFRLLVLAGFCKARMAADGGRRSTSDGIDRGRKRIEAAE